MSTLAGTIESGRLLAESIMYDEADIVRPGAPVFNPSTGKNAPTESDVYSGKCRIRVPNVAEQTAVFGEATVTSTRYLITVPRSADRIRVGDLVRTTKSRDAYLLDTTLRVVSVQMSTFVMRRVIGAEAVE